MMKRFDIINDKVKNTDLRIQPVNTTHVKNEFGDNTVYWFKKPVGSNERPKEQPIQIESLKPDLLQGNNKQLEFNPIPFKKGTYFTRPRQQQEAGSGHVVDYFDSKTGKLLKTMNYKKGGSVQVKGGKGNDDIALVDTNTGEDTGIS